MHKFDYGKIEDKRRWKSPGFRSRKYLGELRSGEKTVRSYDPDTGKTTSQTTPMTDNDRAFRRGYLQAQQDRAGAYVYAEAMRATGKKGVARYASTHLYEKGTRAYGEDAQGRMRVTGTPILDEDGKHKKRTWMSPSKRQNLYVKQNTSGKTTMSYTDRQGKKHNVGSPVEPYMRSKGAGYGQSMRDNAGKYRYSKALFEGYGKDDARYLSQVALPWSNSPDKAAMAHYVDQGGREVDEGYLTGSKAAKLERYGLGDYYDGVVTRNGVEQVIINYPRALQDGIYLVRPDSVDRSRTRSIMESYYADHPDKLPGGASPSGDETASKDSVKKPLSSKRGRKKKA